MDCNLSPWERARVDGLSLSTQGDDRVDGLSPSTPGEGRVDGLSPLPSPGDGRVRENRSYNPVALRSRRRRAKP
ncbi:MAG: hypothetical protein U9Q82_14165 [Chloroflexota bacterium]|nr:hypothetical protein [Chloroflexota bacterium]